LQEKPATNFIKSLAFITNELSFIKKNHVDVFHQKSLGCNFGIKLSKITVLLSFVLVGFGCKGTEPSPTTPVVTQPTTAKQYDTPLPMFLKLPIF
jgi:hypothetical protein